MHGLTHVLCSEVTRRGHPSDSGNTQVVFPGTEMEGTGVQSHLPLPMALRRALCVSFQPAE